MIDVPPKEPESPFLSEYRFHPSHKKEETHHTHSLTLPAHITARPRTN